MRLSLASTPVALHQRENKPLPNDRAYRHLIFYYYLKKKGVCVHACRICEVYNIYL